MLQSQLTAAKRRSSTRITYENDDLRYVYIVSAASGKLVHSFSVQHGEEYGNGPFTGNEHKWSPTANLLASASLHGLMIWDAVSGSTTCTDIAAAGDCLCVCVAWAPCGRWLVVTATGATGKSDLHNFYLVAACGSTLWSAHKAAGVPVLHSSFHGPCPMHVLWSSSGHACLVREDNRRWEGVLGEHQLIHFGSGPQQDQYPCGLGKASFSPCGRFFVASGCHLDAASPSRRGLHHWRLTDVGDTATLLDTFLDVEVDSSDLCIGWHPNPRLVGIYAIANARGHLYLVNGLDGTLLHKWNLQTLLSSLDFQTTLAPGMRAYWSSIAWAHDGRRLCLTGDRSFDIILNCMDDE